MKEIIAASLLRRGRYKEAEKEAYEEQCEQGFVHQEQPNEDYFEGFNDYWDGTMSI